MIPTGDSPAAAVCAASTNRITAAMLDDFLSCHWFANIDQQLFLGLIHTTALR